MTFNAMQHANKKGKFEVKKKQLKKPTLKKPMQNAFYHPN